MENDSISIAAKDDATLEVARDVAKQSKTLAILLASTDETRQKEPISLPKFEASTLNIVFEWCEQHSGADAAHKDFSMQTNFANEYARPKLTPWQTDFFYRNREHWWELAVAASYLDVPYLYYSTCLVISKFLECIEWDEEVPESVSDDVLCDVLRFLSHDDIVERDPPQPRWKRVLEENVRALPLEVVWADIKGDKIGVSMKEVFDDLESLCRHAVEKCYAFRDLSISHFGEDECAVVHAFLDQSSARLRVRCLEVNEFSRGSRGAFRTCMSTLTKLAERLNFLEEVRMNVNCDMQAECLAEEPDLLAFPKSVQKLYINVYTDDTKSFIGFVETLYASWTRYLSIDLFKQLTDPLPLLTKIYKKFASDAELAPLRIIAGVPLSGETLASLQQFAVSRGFSGTTTDSACEDACAYEKKRGNEWKIAFDYTYGRLTIETKNEDE